MPSPKPKIIIVDDDRETRELLAMALQMEDFEVTQAARAPRGGPKVQDYLARRREVGGYGHYLRLRRKIRTH